MKKILSIVLVLALSVSLLCVPALAAGREGKDTPDSDTSYAVTIKMDGGEVIHKYYVDIDYPTSLVFTYTKGESVWDPNDYAYDVADDDGWDGAKSFKITNHSDQAIHYEASASITNNTYGDLEIVVSNGEADIAACQVGDADGARNATFTVGISGVPNENLTDRAVGLGVVRILISKA